MSEDLVRVEPSDALRPARAQRAELVLPLAAYLAEFHGAVHGQARQPAALRDTAVKELTNVRHWALNRVGQK